MEYYLKIGSQSGQFCKVIFHGQTILSTMSWSKVFILRLTFSRFQGLWDWTKIESCHRGEILAHLLTKVLNPSTTYVLKIVLFPLSDKFLFSHPMILDQLRFRGLRRKQRLLFCWQIYMDNYSVFHEEKTIFCSFTNFWIYHITRNHRCVKFNGLMPFSCIHGTGLVFFLAPKRCTTVGWWPTTQSHQLMSCFITGRREEMLPWMSQWSPPCDRISWWQQQQTLVMLCHSSTTRN